MARCCAVTHTSAWSGEPDSCMHWTTGQSLIASGRVPNIKRIRFTGTFSVTRGGAGLRVWQDGQCHEINARLELEPDESRTSRQDPTTDGLLNRSVETVAGITGLTGAKTPAFGRL